MPPLSLRILRPLSILSATAVLAACSNLEVIHDLPTTYRNSAYVGEIEVTSTSGSLDTSIEHLEAAIRSHFAALRGEMPVGDRPLVMTVTVHDYDEGGLARAFLFGDHNDMTVTITLTDPETGETVAEMVDTVAHSSGGGLLGMAMTAMTDQTRKLAENLADDVQDNFLEDRGVAIDLTKYALAQRDAHKTARQSGQTAGGRGNAATAGTTTGTTAGTTTAAPSQSMSKATAAGTARQGSARQAMAPAASALQRIGDNAMQYSQPVQWRFDETSGSLPCQLTGRSGDLQITFYAQPAHTQSASTQPAAGAAHFLPVHFLVVPSIRALGRTATGNGQEVRSVLLQNESGTDSARYDAPRTKPMDAGRIALKLDDSNGGGGGGSGAGGGGGADGLFGDIITRGPGRAFSHIGVIYADNTLLYADLGPGTARTQLGTRFLGCLRRQ